MKSACSCHLGSDLCKLQSNMSNMSTISRLVWKSSMILCFVIGWNECCHRHVMTWWQSPIFQTKHVHSSSLHNSRLIRRIQQNKIYKKFRDWTRNWTWITCLTVRHLNHYTRMFSVLVWGCNWILFMHGWFCPIHLIHLIGWKSLQFEKTRLDLFKIWPFGFYVIGKWVRSVRSGRLKWDFLGIVTV